MPHDSTSSHTIPLDEQPIARFWWLKRLSAATAICGLLFAASWVLWDQYSRHEINRRLRAYAVAGEPVLPLSLHPLSVPESDNAALLYIKAANAVSVPPESPSNSVEEFDGRLPYPPEWLDMAHKAIEANGESLRLAREAQTRLAVDWGIQLASPPMKTQFPKLSSQRALASLMVDTALYQHFTGDDARAFADARGVLHQAATIEQGGFLIMWLVGQGIEALAADGLQIMAVDLRVQAEGSADANSRAVPRAAMRSLIAELLDDGPSRQRAASALRRERAIAVKDIPTMLPDAWAIRPASRLDVAALMDRYSACADALALAAYPAATAAMPACSPLSDAVRAADAGPGMFSMFSRTASPGVPDGRLVAHGVLQLDFTERFLTRMYRGVSERRVLAITLAFRLYVLDHGGRFPRDLNELVPAYLPALPPDPFAPDGRSFGYRLAEGGRRPVLYGVGVDGVDNTQAQTPDLGPRLLTGWQDTAKQPDDQYRDLTAWVSSAPRKPFTSYAQRQAAMEQDLEPQDPSTAATRPSGETEHDAAHTDAPREDDEAEQPDGAAQ